jgi:uncharacterized membrane protein (UPF0136 family)
MPNLEPALNPVSTMTSKTGKLMMQYGIFLIAAGAVGFLSNPEKAKTALISGGTFGALSFALGVMMKRGAAWSLTAARVLTLLLSGVFVWRAWASWSAYAGGQSGKFTAGLIITTMCVASLAMLSVLLRARPAAK